MAQYLLKLSGSNEIESVFEWDGSGSLTPPLGYEFQIISDFEIQSISYSSSFIETSVTQSDIDGKFNGELYGTFKGNVIGSTYDGRSMGDIVNSTEYGKLYEVNPSNFSLNTFNSQSWFSVTDESSIFLSGNNGTARYSQSLAEIANDYEKNYILILKDSNIPPNTAKYLVKNTELIGSYDKPAYYLNVENINYNMSNLFNNNVGEFGNEQNLSENGRYVQKYWHIDFDFNVAKDPTSQFTGSFTGSFEGDAELTGSFFGIFKGLLDGTASNSAFSQTASFAQTASRIDVIQKSTNWTKPSWAKTIRVTCVGGGGGGGAAPALEDTMSLTTGGGGGGGGTITTGEFDARTLSDVISITVGAGGLGAIHDGTNLIGPSVGGDTYFGRYLIARGGNKGENGMVGGVTVVRGGSSIANINYLNTGAGGGGAGTINGIMELSTGVILDASKAPPLPLPRTPYLSVGEIGSSYYTIFPTPVPAVIAPTGGGGGLGYDDDNGGRQDGITNGGKISPYQLTSQENKFASLTPTEYGSGSYEIVDSESIDLGRYPAYNTTIGLGGRGGNPYYIDIDLSSAMPTDGTMYGGGGGGAFGGGIIGRYTNGEVNGTPYNFGANGAQGVVVIISEA